MIKNQTIKIFEERNIRAVWDDERSECFYSILDMIEVLTNSRNTKQYIKNLKQRDIELKTGWSTVCTLVEMISKDGKVHKEMATTIEGIIRIVQSLPSSKAEQFNQAIAQIAADSSNYIRNSKIKYIERSHDMYFVKMTDIIFQICNSKIANHRKRLYTFNYEEKTCGLSREEKILKNNTIYEFTQKIRKHNPKSFGLARIAVYYEDVRDYALNTNGVDKDELHYRIKRCICSMKKITLLYKLSISDVKEYFVRNNYTWRSELFLFHLY